MFLVESAEFPARVDARRSPAEFQVGSAAIYSRCAGRTSAIFSLARENPRQLATAARLRAALCRASRTTRARYARRHHPPARAALHFQFANPKIAGRRWRCADMRSMRLIRLSDRASPMKVAGDEDRINLLAYDSTKPRRRDRRW